MENKKYLKWLEIKIRELKDEADTIEYTSNMRLKDNIKQVSYLRGMVTGYRNIENMIKMNSIDIILEGDE